MKLSKIYSNIETFKCINFNNDINFILSSDHSVGKSTLFSLIDFCLLKDSTTFRKTIFKDYVFYLELELGEHRYITIKRPTTGSANICVKETEKKSFLLDYNAFDRVGGLGSMKEYLNKILNFRVDDFRNYLSYFLRDQDNQSDVFRLNKFSRSQDIFFKPVVANLLSIDGKSIKEKYEVEKEIEQIEQEISLLLKEDLKEYNTKGQIEAELARYKQKLKDKEDIYLKFDFYLSEKNISKELIDNIETKISILNKKRNSITREISYINKFIKQDTTINKDDLEDLFREMKMLFPDELRKNYESVINFNKQIAEERIKTFNENKAAFEKTLEELESELQTLNADRMQILSILESTDSIDKFRKLQEEVVNIKTSIELHNEKLKKFALIDEKKAKINSLKDTLNEVIKKNKNLIRTPFIETLQNKVNEYSNIIFKKDATFYIGLNNQDNIEFGLKLENEDSFDNDLDKGNTIRKLLCFVFSAAVLEMYQNENFFHFLAFDSPFDGDKNEWQKGTFEAITRLANRGMQVIITSIDDVISPVLDMKKVKEKTVLVLSEKDKLICNF